MKINSDKDLDELFQNKLAEEKMGPSAKLWNNIEAELDKEKRRPAFYWWLGIGAALLLLLSGSYFLLRDTSDKNADQKNISALDRSADKQTIDNEKKVGNGQLAVSNEKNKEDINNKTKVSSQNSNSPIENSKKDQTKNTNSKKESTGNILPQENKKQDPDDQTQISDHSNKKEIKNIISDQNSEKRKDEHQASLPPHSESIDMQKGNVTDKKKVDNRQSATDNEKNEKEAGNKKDDSTSLTMTKKGENKNTSTDQKNNSIDENSKNKNSSQTEVNMHGNSQANNKTDTDKKTEPLPPSVTDTMNKNKDELPVIVSTTKKDSTADTANKIVKQPDSSKTIAKTLSPVLKTDSGKKQNDALKRFYIAGFYSVDVQHSMSGDNKWNVSGYDPATTYFAKNSGQLKGNYSFGGKFGYFINQRIAIDAEINYSYLQNTSDEFLISYWRYANPVPDFTVYSPFGNVKLAGTSFDINDNSRPFNYLGDSCWIRGKVIEKYKFINIPVSARFNFIDTKWIKIYARAGGAVNYIYDQDLNFTVTKSGKVLDHKNVNGLNPLNFGLLFGLGTEFKLYRGLGIWAEPGLRYTATSVSKGIKNNPSSLSVPFGLILHF